MAIEKWEADRRFLKMHDSYDLKGKDQHLGILRLCTREIYREIMKEYSAQKYPSGEEDGDGGYIALKQKILDLATREVEDSRRHIGGLEQRWRDEEARWKEEGYEK